jgi:hypothetical protein
MGPSGLSTTSMVLLRSGFSMILRITVFMRPWTISSLFLCVCPLMSALSSLCANLDIFLLTMARSRPMMVIRSSRLSSSWLVCQSPSWRRVFVFSFHHSLGWAVPQSSTVGRGSSSVALDHALVSALAQDLKI